MAAAQYLWSLPEKSACCSRIRPFTLWRWEKSLKMQFPFCWDFMKSFRPTGTSNSSTSTCAMFFFFNLMCGCTFLSDYHKHWIQTCSRQLVVRQVIQTTKLKFVEESRNWVYLSQHIVSTCNTLLWDRFLKTMVIGATMFWEKLKEIVADFTGPCNIFKIV